jgi:hypothetical protein
MTIFLYIKKHKDTGLKYLGKTIASDPYSYPGSGVYWTHHLKIHGNNVETEILRECQTEEELIYWGKYYSKLWNVVESKEWANLTATVNQQTLKLTAGAGSVSEAEQRANREANMTYVERLEPMMVVSELFRSQLESDLKVAKREFLNTGQFNTNKQFENAWNKEQAKITEQYKGISAARLAYLKPYLEAVDKAPNDKARDIALDKRRNAIMNSMKAFPPPEYNVQTGKWDYKTDNARKAAMQSVLGR